MILSDIQETHGSAEHGGVSGGQCPDQDGLNAKILDCSGCYLSNGKPICTNVARAVIEQLGITTMEDKRPAEQIVADFVGSGFPRCYEIARRACALELSVETIN